MRVQAQFLALQGIRRIAVVLSDNAYLEELYEALKRNLVPGQELTEIDRLQPTEMDLRQAVARVRIGKFDAVGVLLLGGQISQFYRQAAEQKVKLPTFGSNIFESKTEIETKYMRLNHHQ